MELRNEIERTSAKGRRPNEVKTFGDRVLDKARKGAAALAVLAGTGLAAAGCIYHNERVIVVPTEESCLGEPRELEECESLTVEGMRVGDRVRYGSVAFVASSADGDVVTFTPAVFATQTTTDGQVLPACSEETGNQESLAPGERVRISTSVGSYFVEIPNMSNTDGLQFDLTITPAGCD